MEQEVQCAVFTEARESRGSWRSTEWCVWSEEGTQVTVAWRADDDVRVQQVYSWGVAFRWREYSVLGVYLNPRLRMAEYNEALETMRRHALRPLAVIIGDFNGDPERNRYSKDKAIRRWQNQRTGTLRRLPTSFTWRCREQTSTIDHVYVGRACSDALRCRMKWSETSDHAMLKCCMPTLMPRTSKRFTSWRRVAEEFRRDSWLQTQLRMRRVQSMDDLERMTSELIRELQLTLVAAAFTAGGRKEIRLLEREIKKMKGGGDERKLRLLRRKLCRAMMRTRRPWKERVTPVPEEALQVAHKHLDSKPWHEEIEREDEKEEQIQPRLPKVQWGPIEQEEVRQALSRMRIKAAPGPSGLSTKILKVLHTERPLLMLRWVAAVYSFGMPRAVKTVKAAYIPKRQTFRMISLQEHLAKLVTKIAALRFRPLHAALPPQFITFRGPRPFQRAVLEAKDLRIYFKTDISKAFDHVRERALRRALRDVLDPDAIRILVSFCFGYQVKVKDVTVPQRDGVLQGDPFSMTALTMVLYEAWKNVEMENLWIYVDDIIGFARNLDDALRIVRCLNRPLRLFVGMFFADDKTEYMAANANGKFTQLGFPMGGWDRLGWPGFIYGWRSKLKDAGTMEEFLQVCNQNMAGQLRYFVAPALASWAKKVQTLDRFVADEFTSRLCKAAGRRVQGRRCVPYRILTYLGVQLPSYVMARAYQTWKEDATTRIQNLAWRRIREVVKNCETKQDVKNSYLKTWRAPSDEVCEEVKIKWKQWKKSLISFRQAAEDICSQLQF